LNIRLIGLLCTGLLASLATGAEANFVTNGGFEAPVVGGNFTTFPVGSTGITGWTVISGTTDPGAGSVDLLSGFAMAHSGAQSVDLDGTGPPAPGGVGQLLTGLTAGASYTLDFFYANNPNAASAGAVVTVGSLSVAITHSGSTFASLNYTEGTYQFVATGSSQFLSFSSTDPSSDQSGIILDDVSVVASVPEPASLSLLGLGLGSAGLIAVRRRRRDRSGS
jgi:hypothetical protein